ncbi:tRNA (adenosine(37)-N6)-dimethylallyltransferase MiaA [Sulfitobacter sp. S190]|uniref:tRNA (adenosine(37)-N6)-dimethylallyltransferase MiaA n=1 Tax=Sulfitobacter sp. S190 TaxID=2867022 RepID=UPI0021A674A4|nr:tRNA (adenosine(37)-N6)-dimethylallyltransferase MiaA [Sulfitobacter sp. S190]UWR20893.1 tRNA (adenosine(37)-N6)-dimethylallyltransferase MiaA [Sulfitobacter sp. S190]
MSKAAQDALIGSIPPDQPVLIAGPTASGKSALALQIAQTAGGVIVNADASQVYGCWRLISARPSPEEEALAPHALYGHIADDTAYSTGHWLREVREILRRGSRPIIVGGTGLYFKALTEGLADIPAIPPDIRKQADEMPLETMLSELDAQTKDGIDTANRARVQRGYEVLKATGKGLSQWQADTGAPLLPPDRCTRIALGVDRDWLNTRIARRFDAMLDAGALGEVAAVAARYNPALPAHKAIGVPELMAHLRGEMSLDAARDAAIIATRQFAKRQRTWTRSKMADWHLFTCP